MTESELFDHRRRIWHFGVSAELRKYGIEGTGALIAKEKLKGFAFSGMPTKEAIRCIVQTYNKHLRFFSNNELENGWIRSGLNRNALIKIYNFHYKSKKGQRLTLCSRKINEFVDTDSGKNSVFMVYKCGLRICPECARIRSLRLKNRIMSIIEKNTDYSKKKDGYRFVTAVFTVEKGDTIQESLKNLEKGITLWWCRTFEKMPSTYMIYSIEVTDREHVHAHALLYVPYYVSHLSMKVCCKNCGEIYIRKYAPVNRAKCKKCGLVQLEVLEKGYYDKKICIVQIEKKTLQEHWIDCTRIVEFKCHCGATWIKNSSGRVKCPACKESFKVLYVNECSQWFPGYVIARILRESFILGYQQVRGSLYDGVAEVIKYAAKPTGSENPEFLYEIDSIFKNRKLFRVKGSLYGVTVPECEKENVLPYPDLFYLRSYYPVEFFKKYPLMMFWLMPEIYLDEGELKEVYADENIKSIMNQINAPPSLEPPG
jgi:hypothetical protein